MSESATPAKQQLNLLELATGRDETIASPEPQSQYTDRQIEAGVPQPEAYFYQRDQHQIQQHVHQLDHQPSSPRHRLLIGSLLAVALAGIIMDYFTSRRIEHSSVEFIHWVEEHPGAGILCVILVYTVATILFIPGALLTIGTGFAFKRAFDSTAKGVAFASTAVFLGASLGSIASFLLGRYLFRDCVLRLASQYPVLRAIDRALERNGFKIMLLLRLSPLIPFNALDYISGVTSISLRAYTLAMIGMLPGTTMFVMVGATASSFAETNDSAQNPVVRIVSLIGGLVFAVVGVSVASYYSKVELDKILQEDGGSPTSASAQYQYVGSVELDTDDGDELQQLGNST